ncbi:MAG: acyl-CoA dehydrogenase family protein [Desulfosudaceae bacterium]
MNYDFTEKEQQHIAQVKAAAETVMAGRKSGRRLAPAEMRTLLGRLIAELAPTGYLGAGLSAERPVSAAAMTAMESLAGAAPELFLPLEMNVRVVGRLIARYGSPEQQEAFLKPLQSGDKIAALGLSETAMNVVNEPLAAAGTRQDDCVRVSGKKGLVIGGTAADLVAVVGQLDDGLGVFLVDPAADGAVREDFPADEHYGPPAAARLVLENCAVDPAAVIGPVETDRLLTDLRTWEDQVLVAAATGIMGAALFAATVHAKTHQSGGKPIIAYQAVGFKLAELFTLVQTAQLMACKTGWLEETGDRQVTTFTRCAKVFCTEAAETVCSGALSILSADGFAPENPVAAAGWAKFFQTAGTATGIARVQVGQAEL